MLDRNNELSAWDRDHFFHPSTPMGQHARGETPNRIVSGGEGVYITDRDGRLCGTFRKIHLPGTKAADGFAQVYEPYYFAHGDTGYRVWDCAGARIGIAICQDRRYPESYRALALQGAEIILIGYNTPGSALALDLNDLLQLVARAADGEALVVQQVADAPDHQHLVVLVVAPVAAPLHGPELRELLLPVP